MPATRSNTKAARQKDKEDDLAGKDLSKFVSFPKLPIELRKEIWELARPEPRFIKLEMSQTKYIRIYSAARIPALLHACRESREIALKWYKLSFPAASIGGAITYFDPTVDGILMQCLCRKVSCDCGCGSFASWLTKSDILAVYKVLWLGWPRFSPLFGVAQYFPAVKDLILIPETDGISRGDRFWVQQKHGTPRRELKASSLVASIHRNILWPVQKQQDGTVLSLNEAWFQHIKPGFLSHSIHHYNQHVGLVALENITRMSVRET